MFFLFSSLDNISMSHITVIVSQIIINQVAFVLVSITLEVRILNFLTSHITIIQRPKDIIGENHSQTNNNQNRARSTKAVIFAKAANQKRSHATIMYFSNSLLSLVSHLFCKKINPDSNANSEIAITHKSVLLSTITRKAHIQLVSQSSKVVHHMIIQLLLLKSCTVINHFFHFFASTLSLSSLSFLLLANNENNWKMIATQNIRTKLVLKLFIEIAILSDDSHNHQFVQPVNEKINVKN
jgi:hypothetical protein